jgi:hypothetical protein
MTATPSSLPPLPPLHGDEGAAALVAAMETASAAIYVLSAGSREPVWANARARELGTRREDLPLVGGRPLTDVLESVLHTGRPETLCGPLGEGGPATTVMARPLRVGDGRGVLLVLESEDAVTDASSRPSSPCSRRRCPCCPTSASPGATTARRR